jgi:AraC-like DNA-binding protein
MSAEQIDVIVRVANVTVLLQLTSALIRDAWRQRLVWFFLPLALCLCGFIAGNTSEVALQLHGAVASTAHLLSGYTAIFLWWFCLSTFDREFWPQRPELAVGAVWFALASADRGLLGPRLADKGLSWLLVAIGFGIVAHLGWRIIRDRDGDLIEARREARIMVAVLLAGQLLVDLSVDLAFGFAWRPPIFTIGQNAAILAFGVWLSSFLLRADVGLLLFRAPIGKPVAVTGVVQKDDLAEKEHILTERLRNLIEVGRIHLDPDLTFSTFVERMGAPERTVRVLINHRLGHDHFRAFLNVYRMKEARRLLRDPERSGSKLVAIAFDSGFASLASFNRVFQASEGRAPSQYRAEVSKSNVGRGLRSAGPSSF